VIFNFSTSKFGHDRVVVRNGIYHERIAQHSPVVPIHPPIPFSDTRTGLDMTKKGPNFREGLGRNSKLIGEPLVIYSKLPRFGL
jgi:hypothetical protein